MTNFFAGKSTKHSEITGTLDKQPQEFKLGDIVESKQDIVAPEGSKGIVILEYIEGSPPDTIFTGFIPGLPVYLEKT